MEVEESWQTLKDGLNKTKNYLIEDNKDQKRKPYLNPEMFKLIEKRRCETKLYKFILVLHHTNKRKIQDVNKYKCSIGEVKLKS